ncbi:MAG TPA: YceD family protein [Steroidobacteraceae bacterium]|nr:YceD family protein [Steroidobacteraceae bacterium]
MSLGWSRRAPVDTLVGTDTALDFQIPLAQLPRVAHELTSTDGEASGHVQFSRQSGQAVADLEVDAAPEVICQRCMQPMRWPVTVKSRIALVSDYDAADRVPEGMEVFLVEGDSISVRDLVDEEVMLALPHVARHDEDSDCAGRPLVLPGQESEAEEAADDQVRKPFAQLGELLKRK